MTPVSIGRRDCPSPTQTDPHVYFYVIGICCVGWCRGYYLFHAGVWVYPAQDFFGIALLAVCTQTHPFQIYPKEIHIKLNVGTQYYLSFLSLAGKVVDMSPPQSNVGTLGQQVPFVVHKTDPDTAFSRRELPFTPFLFMYQSQKYIRRIPLSL